MWRASFLGLRAHLKGQRAHKSNCSASTLLLRELPQDFSHPLIVSCVFIHSWTGLSGSVQEVLASGLNSTRFTQGNLSQWALMPVIEWWWALWEQFVCPVMDRWPVQGHPAAPFRIHTDFLITKYFLFIRKLFLEFTFILHYSRFNLGRFVFSKFPF